MLEQKENICVRAIKTFVEKHENDGHKRTQLPTCESGSERWQEMIMAGSVNKVILIGNLGRDPEVRRTQDGRPVVNFTLATSENWRDKATGERRERTEWHRVVIFNENLCRIAEQYL